jgi:putative ABC transport system ATP-binding protein
VVTHEPDIAEHARRIVRMRDGKIESDLVNPNPRTVSLPTSNGAESA